MLSKIAFSFSNFKFGGDRLKILSKELSIYFCYSKETIFDLVMQMIIKIDLRNEALQDQNFFFISDSTL